MAQEFGMGAAIGGILGGGQAGINAVIDSNTETNQSAEPLLNLDNGIVGDNRVIEVKEGLRPPAGVGDNVIEENALVNTSVVEDVIADNVGLTTYVNTSEEGKTEQQRVTTKEYVHAAKKNIYDFAKKIYSLQNKNVASKLNLDVGKVTTREAADINRAVGINVNGYKRNINGSTINHIGERHGIKGQQDSSMADINDIARIEYVVENYDSLERLYDKKGNVSKSNVYQNYDQTKANVVVYKKIVNGTYYVVEAVPDNNAKTLQVISAYIQKIKVKHLNC